MSAFYDSLTPDQRTIHDALCDSQYLAGVNAGWNAACIKDKEASEAELLRIQNSRRGYLAGVGAAKTALRAARPTAPATGEGAE
jgi:hypothetical protein